MLGIAFMSATATAARADDDNPAWSKFMQTLGLKKSPDAQIHYTERSPLVVPPSRDLPPPASDAAVPAPDWPKNPKTTPSKRANKGAVVPGTGPIQTPNPPVGQALVQSRRLVQQRGIRNFRRRTGTRGSDRSAGRLPRPVAVPALWHFAEGKDDKPTASDFNMVPISGGQSGSK